MMHVEVRVKVTKNIFLFLIFSLFSTNLFADCSSLYSSLGRPSQVSLLWLDDKSKKIGEYALLNKVKGSTFYLCKRVRSNYKSGYNNKDSLKDLDLDQTFYNAEDSFKEVFKLTSEETTRYILTKLYLPDYSISRANLVTQFALSQKEEQVSKYITKKPSKKIKKEKKTQSSYITKKPKKKETKIVKKPEPKKPKIDKKPEPKKPKIVKKPEPKKQKEFKMPENVGDKIPPVITIKNKYVFDTPNYVIEGRVSDKGGSKKSFVFVDDMPVEVKRNGTFEIRRFSPTSEKLKIYAFDLWQNRTEDMIVDIEIKVKTQLVEKLEPLNPSKIRNINRGNVVALVVGIETYSEAPKATYANRDAKFFAEYARYAFGASRNNIKLLIDKDATSVKMYGALEKWLPAKIQSDQTDVIVFFAGHGLASVDGKNLYLLMQDSDTDLLSRTALSRTELFKLINQHNPKSVKIFFDACYSGQSRDEKTLMAAARPISIVAKEQDGVPDNFTVFTASQDDQISSGLKEAKHGIFSYYLMKGLEGQADKNKDREITNGELLAYIEKKVNNKAVEIGRNQVPSLVGKKDITLNRY